MVTKTGNHVFFELGTPKCLDGKVRTVQNKIIARQRGWECKYKEELERRKGRRVVMTSMTLIDDRH
jgi:hypothetical protein